jgi:hypothetical protein
MKNPRIKIKQTELLSDNWYTLNKVTYDRGNGATILRYNRGRNPGWEDDFTIAVRQAAPVALTARDALPIGKGAGWWGPWCRHWAACCSWTEAGIPKSRSDQP